MNTITIKTSEEKFFRQFLELVKGFPPLNLLRPKELDVLAEIMFQNNKYKDLDKNVKNKVIFNTDTRKEMRTNLNMSEEGFNNNLSILRKHKVLDKQNNLISFLSNTIYTKDFKLIFNFKE